MTIPYHTLFLLVKNLIENYFFVKVLYNFVEKKIKERNILFLYNKNVIFLFMLILSKTAINKKLCFLTIRYLCYLQIKNTRN